MPWCHSARILQTGSGLHQPKCTSSSLQWLQYFMVILEWWSLNESEDWSRFWGHTNRLICLSSQVLFIAFLPGKTVCRMCHIQLVRRWKEWPFPIQDIPQKVRRCFMMVLYRMALPLILPKSWCLRNVRLQQSCEKVPLSSLVFLCPEHALFFSSLHIQDVGQRLTWGRFH